MDIKSKLREISLQKKHVSTMVVCQSFQDHHRQNLFISFSTTNKYQNNKISHNIPAASKRYTEHSITLNNCIALLKLVIFKLSHKNLHVNEILSDFRRWTEILQCNETNLSPKIFIICI